MTPEQRSTSSPRPSTSHDPDGIAGQYHPEATVSGPDGNFKGREEIRTYFQEFQEAFPDLHINVWSKITSGDLVSDEWVLSGTNTGPRAFPTAPGRQPDRRRRTGPRL